MHLDEKLNFHHHINKKTTKANKSTGFTHKLAHVLQYSKQYMNLLFDIILIMVTSFIISLIMKVFTI